MGRWRSLPTGPPQNAVESRRFGEAERRGVEPTERGAATPHRFSRSAASAPIGYGSGGSALLPACWVRSDPLSSVEISVEGSTPQPDALTMAPATRPRSLGASADSNLSADAQGR